MAHFAHWLSVEKTTLNRVGEQTVFRFLSVHLAICNCPYPVHRTVHESRAALRHLLNVLRKSGAIVNRPEDRDPLYLDLSRFDGYMDRVSELSPSTRRQRVSIVRKFLLTEHEKGVGTFKFQVQQIS